MICPIFKRETDVLFYNRILEDPHYGLRKGFLAFIAYLKPDDYLKLCWLMQAPDLSFEEYIEKAIDKRRVRYLLNMAKEGARFYLPFVDFSKMTQEGRHRVYCAKLYGCKLVPVVIVVEVI